jgi:hypothetical protein
LSPGEATVLTCHLDPLPVEEATSFTLLFGQAGGEGNNVGEVPQIFTSQIVSPEEMTSLSKANWNAFVPVGTS